VKLVALVKSTDKNTKLDSFYQEFPTNLGLEEQESKEALYDLWAKAWKEKKTIGFLAPTTEQKKNLVAALQLISDAGILISPEHSRLLPQSGIGHNASFTQLSLN
jgi:CRISPR/Cas system CSM-associated protein Csm4 (group 5 of RAMP superfamily)